MDSIAIALVVAIVAATLVVSGALGSDFSDNSDEPAHVVSSLMVRDYLTEAFPGNPLEYARDYYVHYPKVAIGHWPPLFYGAEAVWTLVWGRTRAALVIFPALICAVFILSLYFWARRECGSGPALVATLLLALTPLMKGAVYRVAPGTLMALFAFWSITLWSRYLDQGRRRLVVGAVVLAGCAVLTHGRGAVLVPAFVIAYVIQMGVRRRPVWLLLGAMVLVLLPFVPHYFGYTRLPALGVLLSKGAQTAWGIYFSIGIPILALAAIGLERAIRGGARWRAMAALLLGGAYFHCIAPVPVANRYLIPFALLPLAAWSAAGLQLLSRRLRPRHAPVAAVVLCAVVAGQWLWTPPRKRDLGYHRLLGPTAPAGGDARVALVAGEAVDEGAYVAERALRDGAARRFVLRASKVLSRSSWAGFRFHLFYDTPAAVVTRLDELHVGFIVLQTSSGMPHVGQLRQAIRERPDVWSRTEAPAAPAGVVAYRRIAPYPDGPLRIDIETGFGRFEFRER